ncbi:MAG: hypothetical protein QXK69_08935 [Candidatus Caldarchaeum sp.]
MGRQRSAPTTGSGRYPVARGLGAGMPGPRSQAFAWMNAEAGDG